jgi:PAS domain S-box-containing protein
MIFTINDREEYVYVSPAVKDMLGYNETELIGKPFLSLVNPEDVPIIQEETRSSHQPGYKVSSESEYRMRHASGEWRWVISRGTRVVDKNGRFLHFLGIARDITERKRAELSLREAEFRYRTVADFTYDWEYWQNPDKSYVYVSPSCERISGYNADDFIKNPNLLSEIILPADKELWLHHIKQISQQKDKNELQFRINKKNGGIAWIEHICQPVINEQGKYLGNRASNRDITDRKQIEEEKERIEEKAQIASRLTAIGEMAAGVAHEINNPLTSVLGFSQMIMEKENIPEDLKANLRMIADGSQRMAEIVKRLLMFARQAKPFKTSVNINEIIENTLKLRDYVLKTNSIEVLARLDPELPWVSADPGQMQQVFLNLIVNAEQAMVKAHGRGTLTISTEKKGNNIRVSVKDDGPGISKENLGRLFEPFFTTKDPGEGTGLGLSLSRSIILEHNGTINVESELRHGATFIIELPVT